MSKRLEMIEGLIAKGSDDPFVFYGRAMELKSLGRTDEALAQLREIHARFDGYVPAWHQAGILCRERGELDAARELFQQGIVHARASGNAHAASEMGEELDALRDAT